MHLAHSRFAFVARSIALVIGLVGVAPASAPAATLLAHWTFDEPGGGTVVDSVNGINGSISGGGVTRVASPLGTALSLDSGNDHVSIGNHPLLNQTSAFSVAFWVRGPAVQSGCCDGQFSVLDKRHRSTEESPVFSGWTLQGFNTSMSNGPAGDVWFTVGTGSTFRSAIAPDVLDGSWHHVAVTATTTRVQAFVDGVATDVVNVPGSIATNSGSLVIGLFQLGNSRDYEGLIEDLRFFSGELTTTDLQLMGVPEPGTALLLGAGLAGLVLAGRRRGA